MVLPLLLLAVALCVALAAWAGWFVARDRAVILKQLWGGAAIEAVILVQMIVAGVLAATGDVAGDPVKFWGYLITALFILPIAAVWAFAERTRWSSVVLVVAAVTVGFLEWRLWQIWTT